MDFKIVEKFVSLNGEGNNAGYLSVFIRFKDCNLNCSYCDTAWANEVKQPYELMSIEHIYKFIKSTGIKNVTLTGGEPLIQPGIKELLIELSKDLDINVEIETNGSIDITPFFDIANAPAFTLDYKLFSSNMEEKMLVENYKYLKAKDSVKFVIGSADDLIKAKQIINEHKLIEKCSVHLSTIFGKIEMRTVVDFMKKNKLNHVKFQPQLHKIIWDPTKRGV